MLPKSRTATAPTAGAALVRVGDAAAPLSTAGANTLAAGEPTTADAVRAMPVALAAGEPTTADAVRARPVALAAGEPTTADAG